MKKILCLCWICLLVLAVGCGATSVCPQGSAKNTAGKCVLVPADVSVGDATTDAGVDATDASTVDTLEETADGSADAPLDTKD